jgi:hypothetical protein
MYRSATLIIDMKAAMRAIPEAGEGVEEEEEVEEVEDAEHRHQRPTAGEADNRQTATIRLNLAPPVIARSEMPQIQQRAKVKASNWLLRLRTSPTTARCALSAPPKSSTRLLRLVTTGLAISVR